MRQRLPQRGKRPLPDQIQNINCICRTKGKESNNSDATFRYESYATFRVAGLWFPVLHSPNPRHSSSAFCIRIRDPRLGPWNPSVTLHALTGCLLFWTAPRGTCTAWCRTDTRPTPAYSIPRRVTGQPIPAPGADTAGQLLRRSTSNLSLGPAWPKPSAPQCTRWPSFTVSSARSPRITMK